MRKKLTLPIAVIGRGSRPGLRSGLLLALALTAIVAVLPFAGDGVWKGHHASGGARVWFAARVAAGSRTPPRPRVAAGSPLPLEGIFENCPLDTAMALCTQRLAAMHAGGMGVVVVTAWSGSLSSLAEYAAAAHSLGMSVMWELSNPGWWQEPTTSTDMAGYFPDFAKACGCDQNGELLSYLIGWLGVLPGTYGYYAADDSMLSAGDRAGVAAYVSHIKQRDPRHLVMIGSFGLGQAQEYEGIADLIGDEIYPVKSTSLLPVTAHEGAWNSIAQAASQAQRAAAVAHRQSAFILQAFTWGDNVDDGSAVGACSEGESNWSCYASLRYPSRGEQLQLRNEILLHAHPTLILWWSFPGTYGQAGDDTYSIYPTGAQAASRWAGLSAAIKAPMPTGRLTAGRTPASLTRLGTTTPRDGGTPRASAASIGRRRAAGSRQHARPGGHRRPRP